MDSYLTKHESQPLVNETWLQDTARAFLVNSAVTGARRFGGAAANTDRKPLPVSTTTLAKRCRSPELVFAGFVSRPWDSVCLSFAAQEQSIHRYPHACKQLSTDCHVSALRDLLSDGLRYALWIFPMVAERSRPEQYEGRSRHAADVGSRGGFRSGWRTIENHSRSSYLRNGGSRLCSRMHCRDYERNNNAVPHPLGPSVWHSPGNLLERKSGGRLRAGTSTGTRDRGRTVAHFAVCGRDRGGKFAWVALRKAPNRSRYA
jgi:hypothetical protein